MGSRAGLTVMVDGIAYDVGDDGPFVFGRSSTCDMRLDPADTGISRRAGAIEHAGGRWWLSNLSTSHPLYVIDSTRLRKVVAMGTQHALAGELLVIVEGLRGSHTLIVVAPAADAHPAADPGDGPATGELTTAWGGRITLNERDRMALAALFRGYLLDPPHYDPQPKKYDSTALRLAWPPSTLRKRVEYVRDRLKRAGVPGLDGARALEALAEHVIATGLITRADLDLIGE
jgi:hypothetical protein